MVEIHLKKKKKILGTHAKELLFLQFSASSQPCTEQGPQWGKGRKTEQVKKTNSRIFKDWAKAFQRKCLKFKKLFYFIKNSTVFPQMSHLDISGHGDSWLTIPQVYA